MYHENHRRVPAKSAIWGPSTQHASVHPLARSKAQDYLFFLLNGNQSKSIPTFVTYPPYPLHPHPLSPYTLNRTAASARSAADWGAARTSTPGSCSTTSRRSARSRAAGRGAGSGWGPWCGGSCTSNRCAPSVPRNAPTAAALGVRVRPCRVLVLVSTLSLASRAPNRLNNDAVLGRDYFIACNICARGHRSHVCERFHRFHRGPLVTETPPQETPGV